MKTRRYILVATLLLAFSSTITGSDCWYCNTEAGGNGYCDLVPEGKQGRTQCNDRGGRCVPTGDDCTGSPGGGRGGGVCDPWDWYGCIELY